MTNIEQQARELLAAEYERNNRIGTARMLRSGVADSYELLAIAAIVRALTPTVENAKHVEVRAEFEKWYSGLNHTPNFYGTWRAAWSRALSAPGNADVKRYRYDPYGMFEDPDGLYVLYSANPTPAARVSVSDLKAAEWAADYCTDMGFPNSAAAIRRLVQAVKGEG